MKPRPSIVFLAAGPVAISVGMTLLRLVGELAHWSERWFTTDTQGVVPSGVSWLFGITWLAAPFGAWFAWKLAAAGSPPPPAGRTLGLSVAAVVVLYGGLRFLVDLFPLGFPRVLVVIWGIAAAAAGVAFLAWPALARVLLAYGLLSRAAVALVMLLAMRGDWGTHYDYVGMPPRFQMPFWPRFLWLALFPQLVFWVAFTVVLGTLAGSLAAFLLARRRAAAPAR